MKRPTPKSTLFPYTTLFRSRPTAAVAAIWFNKGDGWKNQEAADLFEKLASRSEEHTSELQSHHDLVCRLLLEKKKRHGARSLPRHGRNPLRQKRPPRPSRRT